MPAYSAKSRKRLNSCHKDLRMIFNAVIPHFDNSVLCGHRAEAAQMAAIDLASGERSSVIYKR